MNERIKELMPKPWTFPYPDRELYTKEQFEKFAELIVLKCAEIADTAEPFLASDLIKDHFGVE
jgi:hypothetical protein